MSRNFFCRVQYEALFLLSLVISRGTSYDLMMATPTSKPWIESPLWDGFWILNGLWLMVVTIVLLHFNYAEKFSWFMINNGRSLFSSAHLFAPIVSVYGLYEFRQVMWKEKFRFLWLPLLLLVGPIALVLTDALMGWTSMTHFPVMNSVKMFAIIFLVWNYWHFASHNFGVLSLYRVRVSQFATVDRKVDRYFTSITMLILVPLIWYGNAFSKPGRHLFDFLPSAAWIYDFREWIMVIGGLLTIVVLLFEWLKPNRSVPKMLYYFVIGAQTFLVAYSYPIFYFLLINLNHWVSELALVGKFHANRRGEKTKYTRVYFVVAILFFMVIGFLWDHSFFQEGMKRFGSSLVMTAEPVYLKDIDYLSAVLLGFAFGVHFLHMLCDRYLFSFRRPEAQPVVNAIARQTLRQ